MEDTIAATFKEAFPNDTIVIYVFSSGGSSSFKGFLLLDTLQLKDGNMLHILKLNQSSGEWMSSDDIKVRAFPFVYESRHITDNNRRRNLIKEKLDRQFPNHNVTVTVFNNSDWSRKSHNTKGATFFEKDYGTEIDVVLS
eukprot:TRINITY_DN23594_c0_g1_i1.p1 TRINITY_DN23594_c0_g1~~TRINITY_DN23594_c0_g1_i1.p1  ORF type:complete len:140 (-),score=25.28 TRINITY_DN23594_c0_g1_i1:27-446(-)